jgi:8-oxo-dGTP pyrophosphatase MutT (NUDIX family)
MDGRCTRRSRRVAYENAWIMVWHDEVVRPDGSDGIYGVVHFANTAAGVVVLDADDRTILVGQHRYTLDEVSWEIPEGGVPAGESVLDGAKRELREETGLEAAAWHELATLTLSNSVSDERAVLFLATDLTHGPSDPEPSEALELRWVPFAEALAMTLDGRITDAMSVVAIQRVGDRAHPQRAGLRPHVAGEHGGAEVERARRDQGVRQIEHVATAAGLHPPRASEPSRGRSRLHVFQVAQQRVDGVMLRDPPRPDLGRTHVADDRRFTTLDQRTEPVRGGRHTPQVVDEEGRVEQVRRHHGASHGSGRPWRPSLIQSTTDSSVGKSGWSFHAPVVASMASSRRSRRSRASSASATYRLRPRGPAK